MNSKGYLEVNSKGYLEVHQKEELKKGQKMKEDVAAQNFSSFLDPECRSVYGVSPLFSDCFSG